MRVIAGTARGTKLECPPGEAVRPLPELARGALYNILRESVLDATVLDVFAGAGTVGIEALSRGAAHAVFVEKSPEHKKFLDKNLARTHLADCAEVLLLDAFRSPDALKRLGHRYELIYLGPPFPMLKEGTGKAALLALATRLAEEFLAPGGTLVFQHDVSDSLPELLGGLARSDRRAYGRNVFTFYERPAAAAGPEPSESVSSGT